MVSAFHSTGVICWNIIGSFCITHESTTRYAARVLLSIYANYLQVHW